MGLKEKIKTLNSEEEILALINEGLTNYEYASIQTKNSWKNTAKRRFEQILSGKSNTTKKSKTDKAVSVKKPAKSKKGSQKSTKMVGKKTVRKNK